MSLNCSRLSCAKFIITCETMPRLSKLMNLLFRNSLYLITLICCFFIISLFFAFLFFCFRNRLTYHFFYRHHAQVFRVKTVQSAFLIMVIINIIVTALQATLENIAKQVRDRLLVGPSFTKFDERGTNQRKLREKKNGRAKSWEWESVLLVPRILLDGLSDRGTTRSQVKWRSFSL